MGDEDAITCTDSVALALRLPRLETLLVVNPSGLGHLWSNENWFLGTRPLTTFNLTTLATLGVDTSFVFTSRSQLHACCYWLFTCNSIDVREGPVRRLCYEYWKTITTAIDLWKRDKMPSNRANASDTKEQDDFASQ